MSVLRSKRTESKVEYIDNAEKLLRHTRTQCMKMPKRWAFFGATHLCELAQKVYDNVRAANSVYIKTANDFKLRRQWLTVANASVQALIGELGIFADMLLENPETTKWAPNALDEWGTLLEKEAKLIAAVKSSDSDRFPDFAK